jgi:hypothetical protein
MLRFFRHILSESRLQCVALAKFWINRISGLTRIFQCPVRDNIWVEPRICSMISCAVGTAYKWLVDELQKANEKPYCVPTARQALGIIFFLPIYSPYGTAPFCEIQ